MKTEEALFKAQLLGILFKALKHKTHVFHVFVQCATVDTYVAEVDSNELVS
jgi:hypothetical protein